MVSLVLGNNDIHGKTLHACPNQFFFHKDFFQFFPNLNSCSIVQFFSCILLTAIESSLKRFIKSSAFHLIAQFVTLLYTTLSILLWFSTQIETNWSVLQVCWYVYQHTVCHCIPMNLLRHNLITLYGFSVFCICKMIVSKKVYDDQYFHLNIWNM